MIDWNVEYDCTLCLISVTFFFFLGLSAETVKSQTRKPKYSKGFHCSRNAYMLVYKCQEEQVDQTQTSVEVPGMTRGRAYQIGLKN